MEAEPAAQRAKVSAQFVYFGVTCFYRISIELSTHELRPVLSLNNHILLSDAKFRCMKDIICEDMAQVKEAKVGVFKGKPEWSANGKFNLVHEDHYIYIYHHEMHAALSHVEYGQLEECFQMSEHKQEESSLCTSHLHHDFLSPFFMDNDNLKIHFQSLVNVDNMDRRSYAQKALAELNSKIGTESPFWSPASSANNWDENHWTKRLYWGIRATSMYGEVHLTATGTGFDEVIKILGCSNKAIPVFPLRGAPDLIFHHDRVVITPASEDNEDVVSSADEAVEAAHQRPPLKGRGGVGQPKKLGELFSALHVILVAKYLRHIDNLGRAAYAKGLFVDRLTGNIQIKLKTNTEWELDKKLRLEGYISSDFRVVTESNACYHLSKLVQKS